MKIDNYNNSILFSNIYGTNLISINYSEYRELKKSLKDTNKSYFYYIYKENGQKKFVSNKGIIFDKCI